MSIQVKLFAVISIGIIGFLSGWQGTDSGFVQIAQPVSSIMELNSMSIENGSAGAGLPDLPESGPGSDRSTLSSRRTWSLEYIHAFDAPLTTVNAPVLVAVLDTGIDASHEELTGKVVMEQCFVEGYGVEDVLGHGTFIAGIIAADDDDGTEIAGLASDSYLLSGKVADDRGLCRESDLVEGIIWAVDQGAKIINISIELSGYSSRLVEAINYAWDNGVIIIAAAGNEGCSTPAYPAALENCVAVTGLRENGTLAPLANYGDWVDTAAPGYNIYGILPDDDYGYQHGTSFATAYVSGLAARLYMMAWDTNGNGLLNDEVLDAILKGCQELPLEGTGYGLIDVTASMDLIADHS